MPLFVLFCVDKPNSLQVRMSAREAHLAYIGERISAVKLGGPMTDDEGAMAGSLLVLDVADRAAAEAFTAGDPYTKAGLWERVDIKPFRASFGQL